MHCGPLTLFIDMCSIIQDAHGTNTAWLKLQRVGTQKCLAEKTLEIGYLYRKKSMKKVSE